MTTYALPPKAAILAAAGPCKSTLNSPSLSEYRISSALKQAGLTHMPAEMRREMEFAAWARTSAATGAHRRATTSLSAIRAGASSGPTPLPAP